MDYEQIRSILEMCFHEAPRGRSFETHHALETYEAMMTKAYCGVPHPLKPEKRAEVEAAFPHFMAEVVAKGRAHVPYLCANDELPTMWMKGPAPRVPESREIPQLR